MKYNYDLHIHSCLSPCGDLDMTPNNTVNMAHILGCDILGLSDHNTAKNLPAFYAVAKELGVLLVPAMELCTLEEAHVLCLFDSVKGAMDFDKYVYEKIPPIKNKEKIFGEQVVMNENDEVVAHEERLLITAADISCTEIVELLKGFGGVAIPAHVDKSSYSLMASLGDIPVEYGFETIELSSKTNKEDFLKTNSSLKNLNFITNSDAHYLENMSENMAQIELESLDLKSFIDKFRKNK
ncbi:MAG: PHP domain-containing protein [Clostridia bacterium]